MVEKGATRALATDTWFTLCLVLLGLANLLLFLWMLFMLGFVRTWRSLDLLMPLFYIGLLFSMYLSAPTALLGFLTSMGFSLAKQTERAQLLAAMSGGALFNAIVVWFMFRF